MAWTVRLDEEFLVWFNGLEEGLQDEITAYARSLEELGPTWAPAS